MEDLSTYPVCGLRLAGGANGRDQVIGLAFGHIEEELEGQTFEPCIRLGELEGVHGVRALGRALAAD